MITAVTQNVIRLDRQTHPKCEATDSRTPITTLKKKTRVVLELHPIKIALITVLPPGIIFRIPNVRRNTSLKGLSVLEMMEVFVVNIRNFITAWTAFPTTLAVPPCRMVRFINETKVITTDGRWKTLSSIDNMLPTSLFPTPTPARTAAPWTRCWARVITLSFIIEKGHPPGILILRCPSVVVIRVATLLTLTRSLRMIMLLTRFLVVLVTLCLMNNILVEAGAMEVTLTRLALILAILRPSSVPLTPSRATKSDLRLASYVATTPTEAFPARAARRDGSVAR